MVFKSLNELAAQYLSSLFQGNSQYSTCCFRNTETDLRVPKKTSSKRQQCFSFRGAKLLNSLSAESKQASSLKASKSLFSHNCEGGAYGGSAGGPWLAARFELNGGHGFDRCLLWVVVSPGGGRYWCCKVWLCQRLGIHFLFLSFIFNVYINNQFCK